MPIPFPAAKEEIFDGLLQIREIGMQNYFLVGLVSSDTLVRLLATSLIALHENYFRFDPVRI